MLEGIKPRFCIFLFNLVRKNIPIEHYPKFSLSTERRDPITGELLVGEEPSEKNESSQTPDAQPSPSKSEKEDLTKAYEPHLGPVRNTSGVRCAQPPGGRSSVTFG